MVYGGEVQAVLLDTGPIVGFLYAGDGHHATSEAAIAVSARKGRALCTAWEVIGEAYTLFGCGTPNSGEPALEVSRWARESAVEVLATITRITAGGCSTRPQRPASTLLCRLRSAAEHRRPTPMVLVYTRLSVSDFDPDGRPRGASVDQLDAVLSRPELRGLPRFW